MPGISATYSISVAKSAISAVAAHRAAIGVDVLAEQRHFADALVGEAGDLDQHVVERPRDLLAARVRARRSSEQYFEQPSMIETNAVGAVDPRRRQVVELLDLGKADVDLRPALAAAAAPSISGRRCSVCGPKTRST